MACVRSWTRSSLKSVELHVDLAAVVGGVERMRARLQET